VSAAAPTRRASAVAIAAVLGGSALAAAALAGCGAEGAASPRSTPPPLAAAVTTGSTTWATLPLGAPGVRDATFWQLVTSGGGAWTLATPPDVATNGGVVVDAGPSARVVAGVLPSGALRFSPLATSRDGGRSWAASVAPGALAAVPDALAGDGGTTLVLLAARGGAVVGSLTPGGVTTWGGTARARAALPRSACRLAALTGVATTPGVLAVVAGRCASGPRWPLVAVERAAHGPGRSAWVSIGPESPACGGLDAVRIGPTRRGLAAVGRCTSRGGPSVVAATSDGLTAWSETRPLVLRRGESLASTSLTDDGGVLVVVADEGHASRAYAARGASWIALPALPPHVLEVVGTTPSEALAADGARVTVYRAVRAARGAVSWRVVQRLVAPIASGSSS
jgi:hypothetical protein